MTEGVLSGVVEGEDSLNFCRSGWVRHRHFNSVIDSGSGVDDILLFLLARAQSCIKIEDMIVKNVGSWPGETVKCVYRSLSL